MLTGGFGESSVDWLKKFWGKCGWWIGKKKIIRMKLVTEDKWGEYGGKMCVLWHDGDKCNNVKTIPWA